MTAVHDLMQGLTAPVGLLAPYLPLWEVEREEKGTQADVRYTD